MNLGRLITNLLFHPLPKCKWVAGDVAHMIKCLPRGQEALGSVPSTSPPTQTQKKKKEQEKNVNRY